MSAQTVRQELSEWLCSQLEDLIGQQDQESARGMADMLLQMGIEEMSSYVKGLLGDGRRAKRLISEVLERKKIVDRVDSASGDSAVVYRKPSGQEDYFSGTSAKGRKAKNNTPESSDLFWSDSKHSNKKPGKSREANTNNLDKPHKEDKQVTNCLECGFILRASEVPGHCSYCGNLVLYNHKTGTHGGSGKGKSKKNFGSKKQNAAKEALEKAAYEKAVEHKDKLLHFQDTHMKRSVVYDDQCDYFESDMNQWLNEDERTEMRAQQKEKEEAEAEAKKKINITIDLAGRRVVGEEGSEKQVGYLFRPKATWAGGEEGVHANPTFPTPVYVSSTLGNTKSKPSSASRTEQQAGLTNKYALRLQHDDNIDILELEGQVYSGPKTESGRVNECGGVSAQLLAAEVPKSDRGMCLSMHQPWASLLVYGIKRVEGRSWSSTHRGVLWIASTVKEPNEDEIEELEKYYQQKYGVTDFPEHYPTGVLLGCVHVDECVDNEEYMAKYASKGFEETASKFIFCCSDYKHLPYPLRVSGQHKIWKLNENVLHGAYLQMAMDKKRVEKAK